MALLLLGRLHDGEPVQNALEHCALRVANPQIVVPLSVIGADSADLARLGNLL